MNKTGDVNIRLISSDLNGTLVHKHTMMDMIKSGFPGEPGRYERARDVFSRQTKGLLSMKDAFAAAGPLTRGLSLRAAIEYARFELRFLDGWDEFISTLAKNGKHFVINSTGYSVCVEVIKSLFGPDKIQDVICNRLVFGWEGNPHRTIGENFMAELVDKYFNQGETESIYDELLATGEVELGIHDQKEKANLIFEIAERMNIPREKVAHIGDTMGDSGGIYEVARNGGLGIAFNYNEALQDYLKGVLENQKIPGEIILVEQKGESSNLMRIL